ncbi:hypothetical protein KOI35_44900 [Actinoplanes bogorensis]|uniref:Uncharacterized protein n=1 Tax=Paractinoplanes bogorensis TaxID=1610840 RepID=A0ABS5Z4T7_9ACTN|nr:hypothetical protein [Actinoplanes bogorensis]MBU2670663.1 hypothetical protein [Actinoplanes bogorensis]
MKLTGIPLILLAAVVTVVAGAALVRWWSRGRLTRVVGVLLVETLAVLTVGLAVNRHEEFYPSWQALGGDTGTATHTGRVRAGLLDAHLAAKSFTWRPSGYPAWHLAGPPRVTLPADYRDRPAVAFPVVLCLGTDYARTGEAVTVTMSPTSATTPADLLALALELRRDLRVTGSGWVVPAGPLGSSVVSAGLGTAGRSAADVPPALAAPMTLPSAGVLT